MLVNIRGTGESEGYFQLLAPREIQDIYDAIEWIAAQPWCDGNVGMFGVSYLAMIQLSVAGANPPHLKCIFAPWGLTDMYRDMFYQGGVLSARWLVHWATTSLTYGNIRPANEVLDELGEQKYKESASRLLREDKDIASVKQLADALSNPTTPVNAFMTSILLKSLDGPYWEKRRPRYDQIRIPCYIGADWGNYGLHLRGALRSWESIQSTKRMIVGPPVYLDRPLYQMQYESLRWFDHWLKGMDTGITKEKPIKLFVMGTNKWKEADEWPLPETKWTPFYLHENSLLSEKDYWPNEGSDSYFDSPWGRESLEYLSPTLVEDTEVIGPIVANIFASTTDKEILWSLRLFELDQEEKRNILAAGWLRGSLRAVDEKRSKPWFPFHQYNNPEPLEPGKIYEFKIDIIPTAKLFRAGTKFGLRISSTDLDPETPLGFLASTHLKRQYPARITVYHDDDHPSSLVLPITSGNLLGTFMSGGKFP